MEQGDNNNLRRELFKKITEEGITPKPRWFFCAKDYSLWLASGIFILLEGVAVSVIIYVFHYSDWSVYRQVTDGWAEFLLLFVPVFWLAILGLGIFLAFYNLRHVKRGYRYPAYALAGAVVAAGAFLGVVLFYTGVGRVIDDVLGERLPYYAKIVNPRMNFWCHPEDGRLIGVAISEVSGDSFALYGCKEDTWTVRIRENKGRLVIEPGDPIRAVGERGAPEEFIARQILPVNTGNEFLQHRLRLHSFPEICPACPHR